ncbi:MAG TPA: trehalase family glycosidase [Candidatus Saccharimonadales bacterium]|nr:trehalase family glycosidase [Candidatus Saccharimonadales bacterium]
MTLHNAQHQLTAIDILQANDTGEGWTRPTSNGLYPHQWLWDSFFIAIGQRHYNIERAMDEVRSPFRAQWKNGMLPHIIFGPAKGYHAGPELWHCERSPQAPEGIRTSGITQPPMAAEAVVQIGRKLSRKDRRTWYSEMYPKLVRYHQWLYHERNPRGDGLPVIVLSWETGMDNSPPWMEIMHKQALSLKTKLAKRTNMESVLERFRKDIAAVPASERISTIDLYSVYDLIKRLRSVRYDSTTILANHPLQIVDVTFSCILIRANVLLKEIADELGQELPRDIRHAMRVAPHALETLWDDEAQEYCNRDEITGRLVRVPSISTFMPLYAGIVPKDRLDILLAKLGDTKTYGAKYPVPSTPLNSPYFSPNRYWQGPTWINMNWLIIQGLERNGRGDEAQSLREKTIDIVKKNGFHEYYSPLDGAKAGANNFSWTAALYLDLVQQ